MDDPAPPPASALEIPVSRWSDEVPGVEESERRVRTRATRRALLVAAAEQIDARGFHAASLRDIVAAANVTKGALYFHFDSKDALAEALAAEVFTSWRRIVEQIGARGLDGLWTLMVETDAYVARWTYDPLVRGTSRAMAESANFHAERRVWLADWLAATQRSLTRAASEGLLRPEVDVAGLAQTLQALGMGHHTLSEMMPGGGPLWRRMTAAWRALLPVVAVEPWVRSWRASTWEDRPEPQPEVYLLSRRP